MAVLDPSFPDRDRPIQLSIDNAESCQKIIMTFNIKRLALWITILTTILVILPIVLFQTVMHSRMLSRRDQIANAMQSALAVRLEEFDDDGKILSRRELDAEQRAKVNEAIGGDLTGGVPFTLTMCFVPHHRVVARDAKGLEFTFTICFECDEAAITGSGPFFMPIKWRSSLRRLFEENGFLVKKSDG
jgi:hypothetical protein